MDGQGTESNGMVNEEVKERRVDVQNGQEEQSCMRGEVSRKEDGEVHRCIGW